VVVSTPNPATRRGSMTPAATASRRDTEPLPRHSTAPQPPSHRMAVADAVGTTNRNFLLKVANSHHPTLTITMGLPRGPRGITTPVRHTHRLMHRLGLPPNTPPDSIAVATEADRLGAASFPLAGTSEAGSRAPNGILRETMGEDSLDQPRGQTHLRPQHTTLRPRAAMPKLNQRRATSR